MNDYYDIDLKKSRLEKLIHNANFSNYEGLVQDQFLLDNIFSKHKPNIVIHLAAQAGVRYSLVNPHAYMKSNINGFMNILECCRNYKIEGLVYASSSSVYGGNDKIPPHANVRARI